MKKLTFVFTTLLLILISSIYVEGQDKGELVVPFSEPAKKGKVRIEIKKGSVKVKGTDRKDVLITYQGRNENNEADEHNDKDKEGLRRITGAAMDLEVSEKNNYIEINSDSWNSGMDLMVEVPKNVDLHVETYNAGDLIIGDVNGEIVADNYNGKITAERISGSLVANSYNGSIKATFDRAIAFKF